MITLVPLALPAEARLAVRGAFFRLVVMNPLETQPHSYLLRCSAVQVEETQVVRRRSVGRAADEGRQ